MSLKDGRLELGSEKSKKKSPHMCSYKINIAESSPYML